MMRSVITVVTNEIWVGAFCHAVSKRPMLANVSALTHLAVPWPKEGGRKSRSHNASTGTLPDLVAKEKSVIKSMMLIVCRTEGHPDERVDR